MRERRLVAIVDDETSKQPGKDIPDEPTAPAVRKEASEVHIQAIYEAAGGH